MKQKKKSPSPVILEIYNEGLILWLYDCAFHERLREAEFLPDSSEDATLLKFAREGILLTLELMQDDPVRAEIIHGQPLTEKRIARSFLMEPVSGILKAPSGKLRLESANSCSFNRKINPGLPEEGWESNILVSPGIYRVSFYLPDMDAIYRSSRKPADSSSNNLVILFSPAETDEKYMAETGILRPCAAHTEDLEKPWNENYEIKSGEFSGLIMGVDGENTLLVNIGRKAVEEMGLKHFDRFCLMTEGKRFESVFITDGKFVEYILNPSLLPEFSEKADDRSVAWILERNSGMDAYTGTPGEVLWMRSLTRERAFLPALRKWMKCTIRIR